MYGFTEILPGQITVDKILSKDGNSFLDMVGNRFRIGDNNRSLEWNVFDGLLRILNATLEMHKEENGNLITVARIDGETGAALFGKGSTKFNADGSGQLANGNISFDDKGNSVFVGRFESDTKGLRIVIDPDLQSLLFYDNDFLIGEIGFRGDFGNKYATYRSISRNSDNSISGQSYMDVYGSKYYAGNNRIGYIGIGGLNRFSIWGHLRKLTELSDSLTDPVGTWYVDNNGFVKIKLT
jgi:hypothetical protein